MPGGAVFWRNLHADGSGHDKTLHAGLPLPEGTKIGINVWTRVAVPKAPEVPASEETTSTEL
jgi:hypothetical protein